MNLHNNFSVLVLIRLCFFLEAISVNRSNVAANGLLIYRTVSITQQSCNCPMSFSCSCCQSVIILYTKRQKNLCVNFTYQRNGLNIDVALNSNTINTRTVINYKAFQFCVFVPGCFFSRACINILQLNQFLKSIMACLRLDIYVKKKLWQINFTCMNVSTELPMIPSMIPSMMPTMMSSIIPDVRGEGASLMQYRPTEGLSITGSTTKMITRQMMVAGMSEATSVRTMGQGMTEQADTIIEVLQTSSEQTELMTVD